MIRFLNLDNAEEWDRLIGSLPDYDIYYLSSYVRAFSIHGDGDPVLVWWEDDDIRGGCVLMIRDVADDGRFAQLDHGRIYDAVTPYGYGGFIFSNQPSEVQLKHLSAEFTKILQAHNIISVFFRFHPLLNNAGYARQLCEVVDLGKTICLDLADADTIWGNITSKNRNVIRKAIKSGVQIHHGKGVELLRQFKGMYEATMRYDNAEEYYYFGNAFYLSMANDLKDNYEVFFATLDDTIISMAIFIFANGKLHYHLSGSLREYRSYAPSNLLLYKGALWGMERGYTIFHLGGGVGSDKDALYKFKAAFNRNSDCQFSIGKLIVDKNAYNELVQLRQRHQAFNVNSTNYFPLYRAL